MINEIISNKLVQGIALQNQGRLDEASNLFIDVLKLDKNNGAALYSLCVIKLNQGDSNEALKLSTYGTQHSPNFGPIYFAHATALQSVGQLEDALSSYDRALEINPEYLQVLVNSGVLLRNMHRHHEALIRFNQVLTIDPDYQLALANCAIILTEFKECEKAIKMFERLLTINPNYDYGYGLLCYERMHICDWTAHEKLSKLIIEGVRKGHRTCKTLALMSISDSACDHFQAAKIFSRHFYPKSSDSLWNGERYRHKKIKIAYVSPDLREHPVCHLMAGVLEHHDKNRFETIAISLGIDDQSNLRKRMINAFDKFIDASLMTSKQTAQLMRELEIDIALDLGGYTSDTRTDIFAFRPAPVQVNYLGYPGTMGTDYMDYIIADRHVIPQEHHQFYSEKVVYLPDSYLPTDSSIKISDHTPSRSECGLPETGIVFCSFNHDYKISPLIFDIWMRILKQVPDSVLWLMSRNHLSQHNLQNEAVIRGVDPSRLIFAKRVPLVEDHLARYRQADLFLDTRPYNAHTTAADALMSGLPVVTYMGNAFPARVAGSLLQTLGLTELITYTLDEYEELIIKLASNPSLIKQYKDQLSYQKENCSLFNSEDFCRNLESVYISMWRKYQLGGDLDSL
jgi:protein O-GlcNAc transferase